MATTPVVASGLRAQVVSGLAASLAVAPAWWGAQQIAADGGAAVVAYLICVVAIGLPWVWYECAGGTCLQSGLSELLRRTCRRWEWLGWWGVLLAALLALAAVAGAGWSLWQGLRAVSVLVSGAAVVRGGLPPQLMLDPLPDGGVVTATVAGALIVGLIVIGGYREAVRRLGLLVVLALGAAMVAITGAAMTDLGRGALIAGWSVAPGALLAPGLWAGALGWALLSVLPMAGVHALIAARRPRAADVGASAALVVLAAIAGNLIVAQSLQVVVALAGASVLVPAAPMLLGDPIALFAVAAPRGDAALVAPAYLAVGFGGLAGACVLAGTVLDALKRSGPALRRSGPLLWGALTASALLLAGDPGRRWTVVGLGMIAVLGFGPLVLAAGRAVVRHGDLGGIIDHAQVHTSLPIHHLARPWLSLWVPLVLVVGALLGLVSAWVAGEVLPWELALAAPAAAAALWWAAWQLAGRSRHVPESIARRATSYALLVAAVLATGAIAWSLVTAGERARVLAYERALLAPVRAGHAADPTVDLLALARLAWEDGEREQARHVLDLALRHAEGALPVTPDTIAWGRDLTAEAIDLIAVQPVAARSEILERLGLLRRLQAEAHVEAIERIWRRHRPLDETALTQARVALEDPAEDTGDGGLADFARRWRAEIGRASGAPSLSQLEAAPAPLGTDAQQISTALLARLDAARSTHHPPGAVAPLLGALRLTGFERSLDAPRRRWIAEQRSRLASPVQALALFLPLLVIGVWAAVVVLVRTRLGPLPIDPSADTLWHVDPVDVDTQAVTVEGEELTTDHGLTSSPTTSGTGLKPVG